MEITQALHRARQQRANAGLTVYQGRSNTVVESVDRIARLAGALRQLGIGAGDRVGILSFNSDRYYEALHAVAWSGGVLLPVNTRWSVAEIEYSIRESGTQLLIADDTFAPVLAQLRELGSEIEHGIYCGDGPTPGGLHGYEDLVGASDPVDDARRGGSDLLAILYTGGTTGRPKGVMLSHDNVLVSALGSLATGHFLQPRGRLLHTAPMFHLAGLAACVAGNLVETTHVILAAFEPLVVFDAISTYGITDIGLVPTTIQLLVDHPAATSHDLGDVRHIMYGASTIPGSVLERARQVFPNARFTQAYGMTELSPVATLLLPDDHDDPVLRSSAGRAAPHTEVRVVGPDDHELPARSVGEVAVRGGNVMLGYWNRPDETELAVRSGWMHTGDLGYLDENGYLFIVDRLKDMIITGGENVYSAEVESALARHRAVASCAVIGLPDERWGERVHAVVVLQPGVTADADELRESCRGQIATYKLPRTISFAEALPLSAAGKVLKRELRAQLDL